MATPPPQDDADSDGIAAAAFAALQQALANSPPAAAPVTGGVTIQHVDNVYNAPVYIDTQINEPGCSSNVSGSGSRPPAAR